MIDILVCPSVLFIEPDIWEDEFGRASALQILLDYLDQIELLRIISILWSDELEALLWADPVLPPWRVNRDWKLKLVPVIAKKFQRSRRIIRVPVNEQCDQSHFAPEACLPDVRQDISQAFRRMVHETAAETTSLGFCLNPSHCAVQPVAFRCSAHGIDSTLRAINSPKGLLSDQNISRAFWESAQIKTSSDIDFLIKVSLDSQPAMGNPKYSVSYSNSFVGEIAVGQNKREIIEAIANRVSKSEDEARHCHGLYDEPVKGSQGVRRFRVTGVKRIHYQYSGPAKLQFLNYYAEGQHDDGL
jgi:hypothetical protein